MRGILRSRFPFEKFRSKAFNLELMRRTTSPQEWTTVMVVVVEELLVGGSDQIWLLQNATGGHLAIAWQKLFG